MPQISVCILTHNSLRTLERCLLPALAVADEIVVVDSGSTDGTLEKLAAHGVTPIHRPYKTHADQMNFAAREATHDWVLCLDSDEFMSDETVVAIRALKSRELDPGLGFRIQRYWHVMGQEVRAIYPVSSPDRPLRLFNRNRVRFNDVPVDDKAGGTSSRETLPGKVIHDTFFSLSEVFGKANSYTSRLVGFQPIEPSLFKALVSPWFAFLKWYFRKGAWRDGPTGLVTSAYAALYTFLKYFKAWGMAKGLPLDK